MKISKIYKLMSLAVLAMFAACASDDAVEKEEGGLNPDGTMTQKVQFFISGVASPSDMLTRDVPPGATPGLQPVDEFARCNVDRVRLLTFRRLEGSDDSFVFDASNSTGETGCTVEDLVTTAMTFKAEDGTTTIPDKDTNGETIGRGAEGKITKVKGYEYRVIAIGYSANRVINYPNPEKFKPLTINESSLFKIVDKVELTNNKDNPVPGSIKDGVSKFEDVSIQVVPKSFEEEAYYVTLHEGMMKPTASPSPRVNMRKNLTGWYQITPEIFYGTCYSSGSDSEVIKFSDENELKGYLYRGVAKLTVNVKNIQNLNSGGQKTNHTCAIALLADSVRQAVKLSDYDNFKTPFYLYDNDANHNLQGFGINSPDAEDHPVHTFTAIAIDGKINNGYGADLGTGDCHTYNGDNSIATFETFLLPTQTRLYFRYAKGWADKYSHLTETMLGDFLLVVKNKSDGMQATGVIDPISGGEFVYFRRNQRYDLTIDCNEIRDGYTELRVN